MRSRPQGATPHVSHHLAAAGEAVQKHTIIMGEHLGFDRQVVPLAILARGRPRRLRDGGAHKLLQAGLHWAGAIGPNTAAVVSI